MSCIAFLTDAPRVGGAERYLTEVVAAAVAAGHEAHLLAPQEELLYAIAREAPAARVTRVASDAYAHAPSMPRRALSLARSAHSLRSALRDTGAEVVLLNNGGYPGSDLLRLAGAIAPQRRRVMCVHSVPWSRGDSRPWVQGAVDTILWRSLRVVVGATEAVGEGLRTERGMPAERWRKVPYGVREPGGRESANALRAALAQPGRRLVGMVSGAADPGKGHAVLCEAMAKTSDDVHAVIIGATPPPEAMAKVDESRVTVVGHVEDLGPYLHAVDAVVVPSVAYESLPLVVLEAMACGKAVIASRLAGIPEAVEDGVTGRLFPPGDATALCALLEQTPVGLLGAWGAAGRERWQERHTVEGMTSRILDLLLHGDSDGGTAHPENAHFPV
ncbi:MAG: glycosyltransferase family 4 protein [Solirubrobacteraceae bacterium]